MQNIITIRILVINKIILLFKTIINKKRLDMKIKKMNYITS